MSFINISKKSEKGKFVPAEIKCPYCTEPGLKLKWRGRNSQGRAEYTDITTDSLHLCKLEYKKSIQCKFCAKDGLKWVKSADTRSGVELMDSLGRLHNCQGRRVSDFSSQLAYFKNKVVFAEDDTIEERGSKMAIQEKLVGWDGHTTYAERCLLEDPERTKKALELSEKWRKWDFNTAKRPKPTFKSSKI